MKKIGFHYFPDLLHYRQTDLDTWLPVLTGMQAGWLVLQAPPDRAIPENFLLGLLEAGIEPVLHFKLPPDQLPPEADLAFLYHLYAKWGLRHITLFDKPNLRSTWQSTNWAQTDLVERFLDIYLPQAENCLNAGLTPVFPPLEPGGDYWDTAFLQAAIQGIQRRGYKELLAKLVIGAVARAGERSLNWGAGGPERWPSTRPYFTPANEEDHRGFRIFDWYNTHVQSILIVERPLFLFEVGAAPAEDPNFKKHTQINLDIARLIEAEDLPGLEPIPHNVAGAAFLLFPGPRPAPPVSQAWYTPQGEPLPILSAFRDRDQESGSGACAETHSTPIEHYLLLPSFDGHISDLHLEIIRPFIKKYQPTMGFSLREALQARRVTVIGGIGAYPQEQINQLREAGCIVHQIEDHGIDIASFFVG